MRLKSCASNLLKRARKIKEAIVEVAQAKEEVRGVPGGAAIVKVAFAAASAAVSSSANGALNDVLVQLDRAESELEVAKSDLSAEEYDETRGAISMLRKEIAKLEDTLADLTAAMRG